MRAGKPFVATNLNGESTMDQYVANVRKYRSLATPQTVEEGRRWYPAMHAVMRAHADTSGLSVDQCAGIYAACSINTPWNRNIALAAQAIADHAAGNPALVNGGTLGMVVNKCRAIVSGADIDQSLSQDEAKA